MMTWSTLPLGFHHHLVIIHGFKKLIGNLETYRRNHILPAVGSNKGYQRIATAAKQNATRLLSSMIAIGRKKSVSELRDQTVKEIN